MAAEAKFEVRGRPGRRKQCSRCGRSRKTGLPLPDSIGTLQEANAWLLAARGAFRLLAPSMYLQGMCRDCERVYERARWHTRSRASKGASGAAAQKLRRRAAA